MTIPTDDRLAIHELMALHGHLCDDRAFGRLHELFTEDAVYDLERYGMGTHRGMEKLRALFGSPGNHPVGHHVSNVIVSEDAEGKVRVRSKGLGVMADGSTGSVVYEDVVVKTQLGWRLAYRAVIGRERATQTQGGESG